MVEEAGIVKELEDKTNLILILCCFQFKRLTMKRIEKKVYLLVQHCCDAMKYAVEEHGHSLEYAARYREYIIRDQGSDSCIIARYCFNCGMKLPASLRSEWFDILEKEYGLSSPSCDLRKVPKKFRSDQWWKERGYKELYSKAKNPGIQMALY